MVKCFVTILFVFLTTIFINTSQESASSNPSHESEGVYKIEGKIVVPPGDNALENTRMLVDEGLFVGIPQVDGTFVISGIYHFLVKTQYISKSFEFLRHPKRFICCFRCLSSTYI